MDDVARSNDWCRVLGIRTPRLEDVAHHREAHTYARLIVTLLERGEPMSLDQVAARFEAAGIAPRDRARLSLQRCKPARAPVVRDGDLYHLDPHDSQLDLWAFRLGLRPPRGRASVPAPQPVAPPGDDVPLTVAELDEAWNGAHLWSWPRYRLVIAVLDALGGGPRMPTEVVGAVDSRARQHGLTADSAKFRRRGSEIDVRDDGRWAIPEGAAERIAATRAAVRERVTMARRYRGPWHSPEERERARRAEQERREAHRKQLEQESRALLVVFPRPAPAAAALLDVSAHRITTFVGEELDDLRQRLPVYDALGAMDVRIALRGVGFDPGLRRLLELGPPQKTRRLNRRGRTLRITMDLLVRGTCDISRPFGDARKMRGYLAKDDLTRLRRRLASDVKSLHAIYEYGRLHGAVRLRWGFLDEQIPVPWAHFDERRLHELARDARKQDRMLEVVTGSAPGWAEPWARARPVTTRRLGLGRTVLIDPDGREIDPVDVQRARIREDAR